MYQIKEVLKTKVLGNGMIVKDELVDGSKLGVKDFKVKSAYNSDGVYIGDLRTARLLYNKLKVKPVPATPSGKVCAIGFNKKRKVWIGWNARYFVSFGIGDTFDGVEIKDEGQAKEATVESLRRFL